MLSTPVQAYLPSFGTRWLFRLWLGFSALIFASGCYWGWQTWRELYRHEEANLLTLSAALATSTHADLHGLEVSLLLLRQQSQDLSGTAPSPLQKLLHQYLRMQPHVAAVGMTLANGKIVAAGHHGKTLAGLWQALLHPRAMVKSGVSGFADMIQAASCWGSGWVSLAGIPSTKITPAKRSRSLCG